MNLHIRPPLAREWPACRMLLPETFADVASREYLLCLRDESPRIVAAASFRRTPDSATQLRIHVVPPLRRRRVASRIVGYIARSGVQTIGGVAEITREPGVVAFSACCGFARVETLTTVEADMADMRAYMARLRARIPLPAGAQVIALSQAPAAEVATLHARHVAQETSLRGWHDLMTSTPNMEHSPVVMLDGRVVGLILWELAGDLVVVRSRVVVPEHVRSWVNVVLLAEGLDRACAGGARRVRFAYADSNRDTEKLASRFRATVTSEVARFERRLAA